MESIYFVYIIKSLKDGKFYTGFTIDIGTRLREHSRGDKATKSTKNRGPFQLVHVEVVESKKEALKLERYFKSGAGREIRKEITK